MSETNVPYKALLIGNGQFDEDPHNLQKLKGPVNDVGMMERVLTHPQVGLHDEGCVTALVDRTRSEIVAAAEEFFCEAGRDDQLLFYYSGHGRLDSYGKLYLCARDTRTDRLMSSAISNDKIGDMIDGSKSSRIVIILDCCHSGAFKGGGEISQTLAGEGRFILTSSRSSELSSDATGVDAPSAFTKHLVKALVSGEVDASADGFISIGEVYNYVLPRLHSETKQLPERHFYEAVGDLLLGRAPEAGAKIVVSPKAARARPDAETESAGEAPGTHLCVSETSLEFLGVKPGEQPLERVIDVFDREGGTLRWTAEGSDEWIAVAKGKGHFTVKLFPEPGVNEGSVAVRDEVTGASTIIRIKAVVDDSKPEPKLVLSSSNVAFEPVSLGADRPTEVVRLVNEGGGDLNPHITSAPDWLAASLVGETLELTLETGEAGSLSGSVALESEGGKAFIDVSAKVRRGPILKLSRGTLDFGTVTCGRDKELRLGVGNDGDGKLDWDFKTSGDFFKARRVKDHLSVSLLPDAETAHHYGSIYITSNGGDATVGVKAEVTPDEFEMDVGFVTPQTGGVNLTGTWVSPSGTTVQFMGSGAQFRFVEYNLMGVAVSEGVATVQGNTVQMQAQNVLQGQFAVQAAVSGTEMSGTATGLFGAMPFYLSRA